MPVFTNHVFATSHVYAYQSKEHKIFELTEKLMLLMKYVFGIPLHSPNAIKITAITQLIPLSSPVKITILGTSGAYLVRIPLYPMNLIATLATIKITVKSI